MRVPHDDMLVQLTVSRLNDILLDPNLPLAGKWTAHLFADTAILGFLRSAGYKEIADAYDAAEERCGFRPLQ
jgi:hypothetical protein